MVTHYRFFDVTNSFGGASTFYFYFSRDKAVSVGFLCYPLTSRVQLRVTLSFRSISSCTK